MSDILRALRNSRGLVGAILLILVWQFPAPMLGDVVDFYRASYETAEEQATKIEEEMKDDLVAEQARSYCWQVAGESVPVFDKQGQLLQCKPRRK